MKIDLAQYLKERYEERNVIKSDPGPVITISRLTGCPGKKVSQRLTELLNQRCLELNRKDNWKWIGKELFVEAAKELDLEPEVVEEILTHKRNIIDQILSSQTRKFYKNDITVRKTLGEVIRSMANDGHVVILGRGGVSITRDIYRSLHISLQAPIEWRVKIISEKENISRDEALKYITEMDKNRSQYRHFFEAKTNKPIEFDINFNCETLCVEDIAQAIFKIAETKKLI
ncbi:MAG: cytidylate kinase-like family protein [Bacteroidota bacterium]|nr:cytidylate kinase-like family protein [Bacteroidota bacterium]